MKDKPDWVMVIFCVWLLLLFATTAGDYFYFRHRGARFTAQDGQTLCQRVQHLKAFPKPCRYGQENH